ncbi:LysR substrate-binding domain-containing protein [Mesorhizobium atlanticum]
MVVSCPMSLAENWLAGCMAAFRKKHPEIEIVLHGTIWEDLSEQIADITISTRRFDDRPPAATPLWNDELVLLCAPGTLEGEHALKTPQDMLKVDWIFVHGRQEYWQVVTEALGVGLEDHDKGLSTNASNIALELAAMGAGRGRHATLARACLYAPRAARRAVSGAAAKPLELLSHREPAFEGKHRPHCQGMDSFSGQGRRRTTLRLSRALRKFGEPMALFFRA